LLSRRHRGVANRVGRRFHDQGMVSQGALRLIAERGGHD